MRFRAVTFNVFHDYPFCRHLGPRLGLLEEAIAAAVPEVVLLQEVSISEAHGDLTRRLVDALRRRGLAYDFVYGRANGSTDDGGTFEEGSAILSRWPLVDSAVRPLASDHVVRRSAHGYEFEERRIAVRATVLPPDGEPFDVFGAHVTDAPAPGPAIPAPRRLQIEDLARFVADRPSTGAPALLGGDLNARPDAEEILWLGAQGFADLCAGREPGPTNDANDRDLESPHDTANQRIDYLLALPGAAGRLEAAAAELFLGRPVEVEPGRHLWASDHSGIVADLALARPRHRGLGTHAPKLFRRRPRKPR